jgi:HEAT repeat protein
MKNEVVLWARVLLGFVVAVAIGAAFVISIFRFAPHFPSILAWLAAATLGVVVLALAATLLQKLSRQRSNARGSARLEQLRTVVRRVFEDVEDPVRRTLLREHCHHLRTFELVAADLTEEQRRTLKRILLEMQADARALRILQSSGRTTRRMDAALELGWIESPRALPVLTRMLRYDDQDLRLAASAALARFNDAAASNALFDALEDGLLPPARVAALLESSAYTPSSDELSARAESESPIVRFWVAYLAGRSARPASFALVERLASDPDPNVRANAAEAIPHVSANGRAHVLVTELAHDPAWFVRAHAAKAFAELDGSCSTAELIRLLQDPSWWVRENAALALERIGTPALEALERTLSGEDRFARNKAAEVLARLGVVSMHLTRLNNGNDDADTSLCFLLKIGRAEAVAALVDRLLEAPPRAQLRFVQAVCNSGEPVFLPLLHTLRDLGAGEVRKPALEATRLIEANSNA